MTKLKDDKICHRHDRYNLIASECRFGWCVILRCPHCEMEAGMDFGPIECPHKKNENGTLRWYKYPDMDEKHPVAIKRSTLMRKQNQPRKH